MNKDEALTVVAENVSARMDHLGLGVNELARRSSTHPMTVSRLINKHGMPYADALHRIAEVLAVSMDRLFVPKSM